MDEFVNEHFYTETNQTPLPTDIAVAFADEVERLIDIDGDDDCMAGLCSLFANSVDVSDNLTINLALFIMYLVDAVAMKNGSSITPENSDQYRKLIMISETIPKCLEALNKSALIEDIMDFYYGNKHYGVA